MDSGRCLGLAFQNVLCLDFSLFTFLFLFGILLWVFTMPHHTGVVSLTKTGKFHDTSKPKTAFSQPRASGKKAEVAFHLPQPHLTVLTQAKAPQLEMHTQQATSGLHSHPQVLCLPEGVQTASPKEDFISSLVHLWLFPSHSHPLSSIHLPRKEKAGFPPSASQPLFSVLFLQIQHIHLRGTL